MRLETIEIVIYKFNEAPKGVQEKIRDNISQWVYDHCLEERIDTLKAFSELVGAKLDYCLSCVPDRGEFIRLDGDYDADFNGTFELINIKVDEFINDSKDCTLTGCCYDEDLKELLKKYKATELNYLQRAFNDYIGLIHNEYESMLTDDALNDLCESNGYEFTIDGKIY